jgi:hypothetical protein
MVHSFDIHIKQCKELFLAREALKDPRDRKKLPEDPRERLMNGGGGESPSPEKRRGGGGGGGGGGGSGMNSPAPANTDGMSLEDINRLATEAFNNEALSKCAFCGRTFLPEKLAIHNRSCTAENPARRVNDNVRKGLAPAEISSTEQPKRPATSSGVPSAGRPRKSAPNDSDGHLLTPVKANHAGENSGEINMKLENGELRGHIGGMAGRNIRATKPALTGSTASELTFATKEEGISYLTSRIDDLESLAGHIFTSIVDMKNVLNKIKELP